MISKHLKTISLVNIYYILVIQNAVYGTTALVSPKIWLETQTLRYQDLLNLDPYFHQNPTYSYAQ